jgi:hypothetical protein
MSNTKESWGNNMRPVKERDKLFSAVLTADHYIMEDAGREYFIEGMERADTIVHLAPPRVVRNKRIILRWIKQRMGIEKCGYFPRLAVLKAMFRWSDKCDSGEDGLKSRLALFADKIVVLRNNRDVETFLTEIVRKQAV